MREIFNMDNPFFRAMGRLADLMILNLIYIVFSLPVVTIGASTTALYYVTLKMAANEEGYVFRSFWKSFRENLRQATCIWAIMLFGGFVLAADMYILTHVEASFGTVLIVIISAIVILYLMELIYVFPLLSRFENTVRTTLRNAFIMAIADFPRTLLMIIVVAGAALLTLWNGYTLFYGILVWILCGFAAVALVNSYLLKKVFAKYMPKEDEDGELSEILAEEDETEDAE